MLCLDSTYPIINGVSFLPDSHDPGHWYFHPLAPHVVTEPDPGTGVAVPKLSLHKFRGDTSGGFLNMDVDCSVAPDVLDDLRTELRQMMDLPALPRLSPVPLVDASVRLMLLDMESGTSAPAGGLRFVKKISHHAHPAGYAGNQAAFSVQLEQAGVVLLDQALHGELSPIGVVYTAEFLALRPAYAVYLQNIV